jgi:hypothetical protein
LLSGDIRAKWQLSDTVYKLFINVNVIYPLGVKYCEHCLIYIEGKIYQLGYSQKKYFSVKVDTFPGISTICHEGKYMIMIKASSV